MSTGKLKAGIYVRSSLRFRRTTCCSGGKVLLARFAAMGNHCTCGKQEDADDIAGGEDRSEREFEELCREDPDVKSFDESLKVRTERLIDSLAKGADTQGLTFESLKDVTTTLLELDREVVAVILEYKEDVWADKHLLQLVTEYFDRSLAVLDFCHVLDKCIKQARDNQMIVQVAINMMPGEGEVPSKELFDRILEELNNFIQAVDPFTEDFYQQFRTLYLQHVEMQKKLQEKKKKLDKKLKLVRGWIKVSTIILAATCAAVLICAVVAAVLASPALAAGVSTLSALPLDSIGRWFKSLWAKYEQELVAGQEMVDSAYWGTYIAVKDLDNIKALVNQLQNGLTSMYRNVEFAGDRLEPFALVMAVGEIRRKHEKFISELEDLAEQVDVCEKFIHRARSVVLEKLMKHPPAQGS